jgi:hypothetical protein
MRKSVLSACLFLLLTSLALTQVKISGTITCGKYSAQHMLPVGDSPDHSYGVAQGSCAWTKPWKIEGIASKEGMGTATVDAHGDVAKNNGVYVDTMENGDKAHYHYQSTATTKDGKVLITGHHWQLVGGTGKLKSVTGQGTCKGTPTDDGGVVYECTGQYTAK